MKVSDGARSKMNEFLSDDTLYVALLLIVVALTAFGLGRLAERAAHEPAVQTASAVTFIDSESADEQSVVASKKGTKYHLPWCAGAQQMSEENKIYFDTRAEAEVAGYSPAANCKGL